MTVRLRPGETQENLLKRFRKAVAKSGIRKAVRKKRWFMSKGEQRRMDKARAIRRAQSRSWNVS